MCSDASFHVCIGRVSMSRSWWPLNLCGAQFTYSHTSQHFMTSGGISFRLLEPLEWIRLRRHCSCKHAEHTHRKVRYIRAAFSSYPFSMLRERGEAKIASIEDRLEHHAATHKTIPEGGEKSYEAGGDIEVLLL